MDTPGRRRAPNASATTPRGFFQLWVAGLDEVTAEHPEQPLLFRLGGPRP